MQKEEITTKLGTNFTEEDSKLIELVYRWYPAINENDRKAQIINLYKTCGMPLIRDMAETAQYMKNLEKERDYLLKKLDAINHRIDLIEKGDLKEERCREDAKNLITKANVSKDIDMIKSFLSLKYGKEIADKIIKELQK